MNSNLSLTFILTLFLLAICLAGRAPDACAAWELLPAAQVMENVSALESDGRRLYAGTWRGLYISDDNGNTWRTTALTPGNIQAIAVSEDAIYTFVYKAGIKHGMYRSDDHGETWHRKNNGFPEINPSTGVIPSIHQILVTRSGMVIAVGDRHGTYVSRDRGETWRFPAEWLYPCPAWPDFTFRNQILLVAESNGYLWAATSRGELYRSPDNGAAWECLRGDRLRGVHGIRDWAMLDNQLYFGGAQGTHGFARWNEGELAMEPLGRRRPGRFWLHRPIPYINSLAVDRGRIFAGVSGGVYMFDQGAETWIRAGLNGASVYSLISHQSHLYAGTAVGIYRASIPIVHSYGKAAATWGAVKQGVR